MTSESPRTKEPKIDDGKTLEEREEETERAAEEGSDRDIVVDDNGTKRLSNDPDPNLNWDRAPGESTRPARQQGTDKAESFTPIPPPPRD